MVLVFVKLHVLLAHDRVSEAIQRRMVLSSCHAVDVVCDKQLSIKNVVSCVHISEAQIFSSNRLGEVKHVLDQQVDVLVLLIITNFDKKLVHCQYRALEAYVKAEMFSLLWVITGRLKTLEGIQTDDFGVAIYVVSLLPKPIPCFIAYLSKFLPKQRANLCLFMHVEHDHWILAIYLRL